MSTRSIPFMPRLTPALVPALVLTFSLLHPARAGQTVPAVPANIAVPAGNTVFFVGHAAGTQNYVCLPSSSGVAFVLFTPQATLAADDRKQVITHFFSPNASESNTNPAVASEGTIRAAWQHSYDSSMVWGQAKAGNASSDPAFVARGAVPWLLLTAVGTKQGATGGGVLTKTTFVQRVNTAGGIAPASGCRAPADVGKQAYVPYTADYVFYKRAE